MKLPIRTLGLAAAALLVGSALAPVRAQGQQSGVDGQVALRSDGALYLISNGQRRWISTVAATDDEINAIPEGEPILVGLMPAGSVPATTTTASTKPTADTGQGSTPGSATPTPTPKKSGGGDGEQLSPDIPLTVDVDGETKIKRGDSRGVIIKTRRDVTCELKVRLPGDESFEEDSKNADSSGRCKYTIDIPDSAKEGDGKIVGTVREGGKLNRQELDIKIVK